MGKPTREDFAHFTPLADPLRRVRRLILRRREPRVHLLRQRGLQHHRHDDGRWHRDLRGPHVSSKDPLSQYPLL